MNKIKFGFLFGFLFLTSCSYFSSGNNSEKNSKGIFYPSYLLTGSDLSLSVTGDSSALLTESVDVTFTLDNVSLTDTGYFPTIRFVLPPELTYSSATCEGLGTPTVTVDNTNPGIDPYTAESIALATGEDLVIIKPNIGQLTPDQPSIVCTMTFTVAGQTVFVADQIHDIRSLFVLGDQFNGIPGGCGGVGDTLCDSPQTFDVTPTLLTLTRDSNQSDPHATGPTSPITYSINGDLASGATIHNVIISEVLPDSLVVTPLANCSSFSISPAPTSCTFTPDPTAATGGTLSLTYTTLSSDLSISYDAYIRQTLDGGSPVVDPITGVSTSGISTVSLTSTEIVAPVTANTTTNNHAVYVNKSVANTGDLGSVGNTPGDELTWTIAVAISDFFKADDFVFTDTMGDGLEYQNGTFSVTVAENGISTSCNEAGLLSGGHLTTVLNPNGTTSINLELVAAMADAINCPGFSDTEVWGAAHHLSSSPSTLTIEYKSRIMDEFTTVPPSGDVSIDAADTLTNSLDSMEFTLVGGDSKLLTDSASAKIVEITSFTKILSHKNAIAVGGVQNVAAGDTVTYKLTGVIPGGDAETLTLTDYLPRPLFSSGTCPTHDALDTIPPSNGEWSFDTNTTGVAAASVIVTCNPTNNSIEFAFPDFDNVGGSNATFDIYFTTTAMPEPIADGLLQTNLAQLSYNDSNNVAATTAVGTVNFIGDAPSLTTTKIATATDDAGASISSGNVSGIDSEGLIDFKVTIQNTGAEKAYDVEFVDTLPSGLEAPTSPLLCSDAICGYDFLLTPDCLADAVIPDSTLSDQTKISLTNLRIDAGDTCEITFKLRVKTTVEYGSTITNEAVVSYASQGGGTDFSPSKDTSTIGIASPTVSKSTSSATGTPADSIKFTVNVIVPEGQGTNFRVSDIESSNFWGNPTVVALTGGISGTGPYCSVTHPDICFDNDPTLPANWNTGTSTAFAINLGTITNAATDNTNRTLSFEITGPVRAVASGTYTNSGRVQWDNPTSTSVTSTAINFTVQNATLALSKCPDSTTTTNAPLSLSESAGFRIMVRNTGSNLSKAYDIANVTDTLIQGLSYSSNTVNAYYCSSGAAVATCSGWTTGSCTGTLTNVSATVRAGESAEASPFGGDSRQDISFPVVDDTGNPDIAANAYYVVEFTAPLSCENAPDTDGNNVPTGTHPDDDGFVNGCAEPAFVYASILNNTGAIASYTSQDGVVGGEATYSSINGTSSIITTDLDGDGILDSTETNGDADGDGVPNYLDTDSDDSGYPDSTDGIVDSDGDGIPNYKDMDDDNDGFSDAEEIFTTGGVAVDTDGDGLNDHLDLDSDGDGASDDAEGSYSTDSDGDGTPNYLDLDSDNDGIPDLIEFGLATYDTNGDGNVTSLELNAGFPDLDTNNDGAIETFEFPGGVLPDVDGDGTPNYLDLDSDNDGVTDTDESGLTIFAGADNLIDSTESTGIDDGDAIAPPVSDTSDVSGGAFDDNGALNIDEIPDTDGDGLPNFMDSDSDNDGIPDIIENHRYVCDADLDSQIDYPGEVLACVLATDTDLDGYIQIDEFAVFDHDADLTPDYLDTDSDDDGIADLIEAYLADTDLNNDGSISSVEYSAATGVASGVGDENGILTYSELVDTDGDLTPDMWDLDSDGDTITDTQESDATPLTLEFVLANLYNTDGTGSPDFRDTDSDDDGYLDSVEAGDGSLLTAPVDTDGDTIPDFQDTDSDGDELNDADELTLSTSRITPDSDGDGLLDGCEVFGNTTSCVFDDVANAAWYPGAGSVGAPITDPNDADTDDGGTNDFDEATDDHTDPQDGQGADDSFHTEDPDNDGLTNDEELVGPALCLTDPNDADSDNDGVMDGCEVFGTTTTPIDCSYDETANSTWYTAPGTSLAPLSDPCVVDTDGDGCDDFLETKILDGMGTNPFVTDTDTDGVQDCTERNLGSNPNDTDSDNDGLSDGEEVNTLNTDPNDKDTDNDGCNDFVETETYESDPLTDLDTDSDGLTDCQENGTYGTDPEKFDTDGGGINDGLEVELKTNPLDPKDDCPNVRDSDGDGLTDCEEIDLGSDPFVSDGTIQGSGTKGLFGVGCNSGGAGFDLIYLLLLLSTFHILWRRRA